MLTARVDDEVAAALIVAEDVDIPVLERAEMLMEIAMGLQQRPKRGEDIEAAIGLYNRAHDLAVSENPLLAARVMARSGTAWQALPGDDTNLQNARAAYEAARPAIEQHGQPEELAELELNLGVTLQALAAANLVPITQAISAYQRALRTFDGRKHPAEYAILQNNLAIAFLSMPARDERGKMAEALAVQAFEEGLKVVTLIDHPSEYAMLQNNLGNALQYASSSHALENNLRALDAYDEALKVRTRDGAPMEYANTIANMANCLWNIPVAPEDAHANSEHLVKVLALYGEATEIFAQHGDTAKAEATRQASESVYKELSDLRVGAGMAGQ